MDMTPPGVGSGPARPLAEADSFSREVIELKERVVALTGVAQECAQACHEVLLVVRQVADESKAQSATQSAELLQTLHSVRKVVDRSPEAVVRIIDERVRTESTKWAKDVVEVTNRTLEAQGTAVVQQVQGASRKAIEATAAIRHQMRPVSWVMVGAILAVGILVGVAATAVVYSVRLQRTEALLESLVARQEAVQVNAVPRAGGGRRAQ